MTRWGVARSRPLVNRSKTSPTITTNSSGRTGASIHSSAVSCRKRRQHSKERQKSCGGHSHTGRYRAGARRCHELQPRSVLVHQCERLEVCMRTDASVSVPEILPVATARVLQQPDRAKVSRREMLVEGIPATPTPARPLRGMRALVHRGTGTSPSQTSPQKQSSRPTRARFAAHTARPGSPRSRG